MKPIELVKAAVFGRSACGSKLKKFQGVHSCRIPFFFMSVFVQRSVTELQITHAKLLEYQVLTALLRSIVLAFYNDSNGLTNQI